MAFTLFNMFSTVDFYRLVMVNRIHVDLPLKNFRKLLEVENNKMA